MLDEGIIELYFARDERAIEETRTKYGVFCETLALRLLGVREDAEECASDTYLAAWDRIPPERPGVLRAFLGRITRNLAVSRFRRNRASKRYSGIEQQLEELADCLPSADSVELEMERRELAELISRWLDGLPKRDRDIFIRRYWYCESVEAIAKSELVRPNTLAQRLRRMRAALRTELEKEGVTNEK